jgi:hypothetical protein
MQTIESAVPVDDQPIGGHNAATIIGNSRYLTSWFNPDDLNVQDLYKQLTAASRNLESKISSCWQYVKNIPYTQFVRTKAIVDGQVFHQSDAWLDAGQAIHISQLNCMNKSILLANLLRQELHPSQVHICLNNLSDDGIGGHAIVYLVLDKGYVLETTNPKVMTPFMPAADLDIYESVIFFNDSEVKRIPGVELRQPFGLCCVNWLSDYIDPKYCTKWV